MKASQADEELKNDKLQDAIGHYKEAVAANPDNANYKYKLALALHQAGDTDGERAQLEQAVKLNPDLAGAQNELGYLMSRSGDSSRRHSSTFEPAVHAAPGYVEAWINLSAELAMAATIHRGARCGGNGAAPGTGQRAGSEAERSPVARSCRAANSSVIANLP